MTFKVELYPKGITFTVEKQQTILEAALSQQIDFPNRCQVGACGMCLCRLLEGEVKYQYEPMLTDAEQDEGWIFACLAMAASDLKLTFEAS